MPGMFFSAEKVRLRTSETNVKSLSVQAYVDFLVTIVVLRNIQKSKS